jgi:hypothetical protein
VKNKWLKIIFWVLLIGWIGFSLYYVARDYLGKYQTNTVQAAYQKGVEDSVSSLITEAKKCKPVTAYNKDEKIQLISMDCLNKTNSTAGEANNGAATEQK